MSHRSMLLFLATLGTFGLPVKAADRSNYALNWLEPPLPNTPSARCCLGMAYDAATRSIVLFGGGNGGILPRVVYEDTWTWSNGWTQQTPAASPSARQGAGLAYDAATGTVVLFGGADVNGTFLGDTWTWDGVTWTQQFPPISPPPRELDVPGMAYDAASGTVVLFGGEGSALGDTWEWNGKTKTWTQQFPASSPSPRSTMLAYDEPNKQIVLFGGFPFEGGVFGDTWTWDGVTWTQHSPSPSPSPRALSAIAYDPEIRRVILFGGSAIPGQGLNDTWAWNGSVWQQLSTSTQPQPGRWSLSMDFDPMSRGLVLFGGELTGDPFTNETWLLVLMPVH